MNLFCLKAKVADKTIIANYTTPRMDDPAIVSDDDDSEDKMPGLVNRGEYNINIDSDNEEEDEEPVKEKPKVSFKDTLIDGPKLVLFQMNEAHDKWGHFGEVRLQKMATFKGLHLIGKLIACDARDLMKTKASPISKSSPEEKKSKEIGERLYVDFTVPFRLTGGKWHTSIQKCSGME